MADTKQGMALNKPLLDVVKVAAPSATYLKQGVASPATTAWAPGEDVNEGSDDATTQYVAGLLAKIRAEREKGCLELAHKFDGWTKDTVVVSQTEIDAMYTALGQDPSKFKSK